MKEQVNIDRRSAAYKNELICKTEKSMKKNILNNTFIGFKSYDVLLGVLIMSLGAKRALTQISNYWYEIRKKITKIQDNSLAIQFQKNKAGIKANQEGIKLAIKGKKTAQLQERLKLCHKIKKARINYVSNEGARQLVQQINASSIICIYECQGFYLLGVYQLSNKHSQILSKNEDDEEIIMIGANQVNQNEIAKKQNSQENPQENSHERMKKSILEESSTKTEKQLSKKANQQQSQSQSSKKTEKIQSLKESQSENEEQSQRIEKKSEDSKKDVMKSSKKEKFKNQQEKIEQKLEEKRQVKAQEQLNHQLQGKKQIKEKQKKKEPKKQGLWFQILMVFFILLVLLIEASLIDLSFVKIYEEFYLLRVSDMLIQFITK